MYHANATTSQTGGEDPRGSNTLEYYPPIHTTSTWKMRAKIVHFKREHTPHGTQRGKQREREADEITSNLSKHGSPKPHKTAAEITAPKGRTPSSTAPASDRPPIIGEKWILRAMSPIIFPAKRGNKIGWTSRWRVTKQVKTRSIPCVRSKRVLYEQ